MIKTENLFMRFSDGSGIRYRDLSFETGKSYALLGASGVGKSTLLNLISGILTPAEGTITADDTVITALSPKERDRFRIRNVGYIYQDFKLLEPMSVQDNINVLRLEGVDTSGMDALLEKLGILKLKRRKVNRLSGGEKQRVAIARALALKPSIILMDEPFAALDAITRNTLQQEVLAISREEHCTIIFITHNIQEGIVLGTRLMLMQPGGKVAIDTPNPLARPVSPSSPGYGQLWDRLYYALYDTQRRGVTHV